MPGLFQFGGVMVQMGVVKVGKGEKAVDNLKGDTARVEGHRAPCAPVAPGAVVVDGAGPKEIGQQVLRQRAVVARLVALADQFQPGGKVKPEICSACGGIAAAETDQMFDHHRLDPRRSLTDGSCTAEDFGTASIRSDTRT